MLKIYELCNDPVFALTVGGFIFIIVAIIIFRKLITIDDLSTDGGEKVLEYFKLRFVDISPNRVDIYFEEIMSKFLVVKSLAGGGIQIGYCDDEMDASIEDTEPIEIVSLDRKLKPVVDLEKHTTLDEKAAVDEVLKCTALYAQPSNSVGIDFRNINQHILIKSDGGKIVIEEHWIGITPHSNEGLRYSVLLMLDENLQPIKEH